MIKKHSDIEDKFGNVVEKKATNNLTHYYQNHKNGVSHYYKRPATKI